MKDGVSGMAGQNTNHRRFVHERSDTMMMNICPSSKIKVKRHIKYAGMKMNRFGSIGVG